MPKKDNDPVHQKKRDPKNRHRSPPTDSRHEELPVVIGAIDTQRTDDTTFRTSSLSLSQADPDVASEDSKWQLSSSVRQYRNVANIESDGGGSIPHGGGSCDDQVSRQATKTRNSPPYESALNDDAFQFVSLAQKSYLEILSFLNKFPDVRSLPEKALLEECANALITNREQYARDCLQQNLILTNLRSANSDQFTEGLLRDDKVGERLQAAVIQALQTERQKARARLTSARGGQLPQTQKDGVGYASPNDRHGPDLNLKQRSKDTEPVPRNRGNTISSFGDGYSRSDMGPEHYKERHSSWFVLGKVFCIIWHENAGTTGNPQEKSIHRINIFGGQDVCIRPRRMVVVKVGRGCSWCVPIFTYGNKGLLKRGFKKEDHDAHAVIHMKGDGPHYLENEPKSRKKPIVVNPANPSCKLENASRLCFGKVHTVEHNQLVKEVGTVDQSSLPWLQGFFKGTVTGTEYRGGS